MPLGPQKTYLILSIQAAALTVCLFACGAFTPVASTDTVSYSDYPIGSLSDAMVSMRTFVYPLVLKLSGLVSQDGLGAVAIQYGCAVVSVLLFLRCLLRCDWDPKLALAAASCLLYSPMVLEYSSALTPDLLAHSLSVAAVGFWLVVIHRGKSTRDMVAMAILVFMAYQAKPAYLFLLGFVPVGGLVARWWLHRSRRDALRVALRLAAGAWIPFLMYCGIRWLLVGQFGLVSFGGYNLVGITGQLLREDSIAAMSDDVRSFAERLAAERSKREGWDESISYTAIELQFNAMVWTMAVPIANDMTGNDPVATNRLLTDFSREVIGRDPKSYARWLLIAVKHAFTETVTITSRHVGFLIALLVILAIHFRRGWYFSMDTSTGEVEHRGDAALESFDDSKASRRETAGRESMSEFQTIVWLAIGYAICKFALVILVEPPISRYAAPAVVFLPSIVAMGAVRYWLHSSRYDCPR